ncbi:Nicotinamide riboside transporter pnuC [Providencia stuartii]|nr:Nicotinamide riboside transporter pnuC [Providencia stuartii]
MIGVFGVLAEWAINILNLFGANLTMPVLEPDAFPFWDSTMTVLSVVAMILMTRKYVENWLLWVIINVISIIVFYKQGVYAMSLEYLILLGIALNGSRLWGEIGKTKRLCAPLINHGDEN